MPTINKLRFRRRRRSLTNYKKRLSLLKSGVYRVVIRKTNKRIISEIINYSELGDTVLAYADSNELRSLKWPSRRNRATAYLTGMLLAKKAKDDIKDKGLILDIGLNSPVKNSIPFVFAKGLIDAGLKLNANIEMDPSVYNYSKTDYIKELMKDPQKYSKQFGSYINKDKITPDKLNSLFEEIKMQLANK